MNKKIRQRIGIICMVTGLFAGGIIASASGYVQSNMPGFPNISCWGSLGYSSSRMTATTSSNGSNIGGYSTRLTGILTKNGQSMGSQNASGSTKASIYKQGATGYKSGNGTHNVYYLNKTWTGYTSI